jgi:predicted 2-oxoglutarate/Fe(II)-dependent dioxygenase YbiX
MIFIRYGVGDKFGVHTDAPYRPAPHCKSLYTLMVYLNDDYEGGETRFPGLKRVVRPETGMVLIFPHRLRHEGLMVTRGTKYALHTFILYNKP